MADLLALGLSHFPPLAFRDKQMSFIFKRMLDNPALTPAMRDGSGWPAAMRAEWGDDEGLSAAARHRDALVSQVKRVRAALDAFAPDIVLIWGDDQYENFQEDVIPPYCVYAHDQFEFHPPAGNIWNEPTDKIIRIRGAALAAKQLTTHLIGEGFDAAYSYKPLHHALGHAFTNAIHYLDYDRTGFDYPIIPISINCYGRHVICQKGGLPRFGDLPGITDLDPPAPTPSRLFDLGAATVRALRDSPWRVALVASSGWSHAFLTAKTNFLHPDIPADRILFEALRAGDYDAWRDYPATAIEESGQQEVLNWMCLAGALREMAVPPADTELIETWIFNSSKVFLVSDPAPARSSGVEVREDVGQ
jgi:hypothetical protein